MGEVYRADDLKLGQPVALKFLPAGLERDPERLEHFLSEVRTARQVTHPDVCRVYDIVEADGHHFLSMEYVDGEDLASLLRCIGRLPQDKAVQMVRPSRGDDRSGDRGTGGVRRLGGVRPDAGGAEVRCRSRSSCTRTRRP